MKLLTAQEEATLVQRLQNRDEKALQVFYTNYRPAMLHTIRRVVRHAELAEDILQEGMLKFWLAFPSYDPARGRLFTWALNICRNLAIDTLRMQRRMREATCELSPAVEHLVAAPPAFRPEHVGVREWLDLVAATDRPLLELLYLQGHTHAETAELLKLPLGTVKSRSRRLIQLLGRVMAEPAPGRLRA